MSPVGTKCTCAFAFAALLAAQDQRFGVESQLVLVPVAVTDKKGRFVDGLEASDFLVLDNGRPQPVAVDTFATGVAPIAFFIAVQSSGISAAALAKIRKIGAMIQPLITGERGCAALAGFDEEVRWFQDCTSDPDLLARAFHQLQPGEAKRACMLDAVLEAVHRLQSRPDARRVLLLIAESRDRGSETDLDTAVAAAQAASVTVYAATYSAFKTAFIARPSENPPPRQVKGPPLPGREAETPTGNWERPHLPPPEQRIDILGGLGELGRLGKANTTQILTTNTAGAAYPFTRLKGLENAIERLGAELHAQYVLSFTPENPTRGYHRLEVRLTRPGELRVRARPGYWPAGEPR